MEDFINQLAALLDIPAPGIEYNYKFKSKTQLAGADPDGWTIALSAAAEGPDLYFAVAHEIRHLWQRKNGWTFSGYKENTGDGLTEYNRQPEEVDANAFSALVMRSAFRLDPRFDGMDEDTKRMITDRRKELEKEYS